MRRALRAVAFNGFAVFVGMVAACADFEGVVNSTGGLPDVVVELPQFQRDIMPIIERRCGIGGCHSESAHQGGLFLTRDSAWKALVNRPSQLRAGEVLVRPGNATDSWMVIAIRDDAVRRMGANQRRAFPWQPGASALDETANHPSRPRAASTTDAA